MYGTIRREWNGCVVGSRRSVDVTGKAKEARIFASALLLLLFLHALLRRGCEFAGMRSLSLSLTLFVLCMV